MTTSAKIAITDISHLTRFGIKGPQTAAWLAQHGVEAPVIPNSWQIASDTSLVLRLGMSEFLIEDSEQSNVCSHLLKASKSRSLGVYPVPRFDAAFIISGDEATELFSEICMLNLCEDQGQQALYITQVAGISATLVRQIVEDKAIFRLWCDGTYHHYMHTTLTTIAKNLSELALGVI